MNDKKQLEGILDTVMYMRRTGGALTEEQVAQYGRIIDRLTLRIDDASEEPWVK